MLKTIFTKSQKDIEEEKRLEGVLEKYLTDPLLSAMERDIYLLKKHDAHDPRILQKRAAFRLHVETNYPEIKSPILIDPYHDSALRRISIR